MLLELLLVLPFLGGAFGHAVERRASPEEKNRNWKPITQNPSFFNLKIDEVEGCTNQALPTTEPCLGGYAIRLENGIVVATPYNRWYDAKLPTMFVDEDTHLYTVSKEPLQLYVESTTGALKYTKVGWVPPTAIAENFFHTSSNPLQITGNGVSVLSWPLTPGFVEEGIWDICALGETGQFQVYVNPTNFRGAGNVRDRASCFAKRLAAINANPWKKQTTLPSDDWESDDEWDQKPKKEEKKKPAAKETWPKKKAAPVDDAADDWSADDNPDDWEQKDDGKWAKKTDDTTDDTKAKTWDAKPQQGDDWK